MPKASNAKRLSVSLTGLAAAALVGGTVAEAKPKWAREGDTIEKCLGLDVKKGANGCETSTNECRGLTVMEAEPDAWVYLPEGVCEKLIGTKVKAKKVVKAKK